MAIAIDEDPDVIDGVYYPSEDGKPMGQTIVHVVSAFDLFQLLREHYFRVRPDTFVSCDTFWYWERGNPKARIAPDIMVCFGVDGVVLRRSYLQWLENNVVPSVCFEYLSKGTWRKNLSITKDIYEQRGVSEYFAIDPDCEYVKSGLKGFRLDNGKYAEIAADADGSMLCKSLNFRLIPVGRSLRVIDLETGEALLTEKEKSELAQRQAEEAVRKAEEARRISKEERHKAEEERHKAEEERRKAEEERRKAQDAERKAEELQQEVERLRAQLNPKKPRANGAHPS